MRDVYERYLIAFVRALGNYLRANGKRIASISKLTGQRKVLLSFRGLFRYHDPSTGYLKFMDAWDEAIEKGFLDVLKSKGIRYIPGEEPYLEFPLGILEELVSICGDEKKILKFLTNA